MYRQIYSWVGLVLIVIACLCGRPNYLHAQSKYSERNKITFRDGKYHFKKGWALSGGIYLSSIKPILNRSKHYKAFGQSYPIQSEFLAYYRVKSNLGLGLSLSFTNHAAKQLGFGNFSYYEFTDIGAYGKYFLNNERSRTFVDFKFGYSIAAKNPISFDCPRCEYVNTLYLRYSSGLMFQPGIGVDFSGRHVIKWGVKLSTSFNYFIQQRDRWQDQWEMAAEGIIIRDTYKKLLGTLFFGFYFYL